METKTAKFYAVKNAKQRYFLPSKSNYFNNLQIEYLMIDNGCNTILLPIREGQMEEISKEFPPSKFVWNISGSNGVSACVLQIKAVSESIHVRLSTDVVEYATDISYLRFHLCHDDMEWLVAASEKGEIKLEADQVEKLNSFCSLITQLKSSYPAFDLAKRRKHGLIGQSILCGMGLSCIQTYENFIVLESKLLTSGELLSDILMSCARESTGHVSKNFSKKEFDDLEDEDHDSEEQLVGSFLLVEREFEDD